MKLTILFFLSCFGWTVAISLMDMEVLSENWNNFKEEYGKTYKSKLEEKYRFRVYAKNLIRIKRHNIRYNLGEETYKMGENQHADKTDEEFINKILGSNNQNEEDDDYDDDFARRKIKTFNPKNETAPEMFDWTTKGAITPVRDQRECGSCWAFAAAGAIETQVWLKKKILPSLSEQNLIDCSVPYGTRGCKGGQVYQAYAYVKKNEGIDTEVGYPYLGSKKKCAYKPYKIGARIKDYERIMPGNEKHLKIAVATVGSIASDVYINYPYFRFYTSGVYYDSACIVYRPNHSMLIVGYGTDQKDGDYWYVKNSWGPNWGSYGGYVKMARNKNNHCGIASSAYFPIL